MKPRNYWKKRSEQIAVEQFRSSEKYIDNLSREYVKATHIVKKEVNSFFNRYADENGIVNLSEARRQLTAGELDDFRMGLEEFITKAKDNDDERWTQSLNNAYYKQRVNRMEALEFQINQQIEILAASRETGTGKLLADVYKETYYRSMYEIHTGTGFVTPFAKVDAKGVERVLGTKFESSNWSKRIWVDRTKLKKELHTKLSQAFIRGDSYDRTTTALAERMRVSYSNAARLVRTETAFFVEQGTMDSYKASGVVQKYEILAVLDNRTSPICQSLDGKVFKVSEMEVGVNCPPFHVNCRTTTVPYFDEDIDFEQRAARDKNGKVIYISADTKYPEWYKEYAA
ncbi:phage head morphogenesis protein [Paenibacillaceae bacterium]|nr:phage head morphogenesis protein [Paenibacillaceae bacterium]